MVKQGNRIESNRRDAECMLMLHSFYFAASSFLYIEAQIITNTATTATAITVKVDRFSALVLYLSLPRYYFSFATLHTHFP